MASLHSSQLAEQGGVNVQTLRYYEGEGLLPRPPRTASGYRTYPADTVDLIRFIKRAQGLGFTLRQIKQLIALREHPEAACADVRRQAEAKLTEIAEKMRSLRTMQRELTRLVDACAGPSRSHSCPVLTRLEGCDEAAASKGKR